MQVPNTSDTPIGIAVLETAREDRWQQHFEGMDSGLHHYEDLNFYYDILSPLTKDVHPWETHYNHVMSGHEAIIEWYKSTGMKPYLAKLDEAEKDELAKRVLSSIRGKYKVQRDGSVLFPFRRLFFIAYRTWTAIALASRSRAHRRKTGQMKCIDSFLTGVRDWAEMEERLK